MATQTIPTLSAEIRTTKGTRKAEKLRETGKIPAVVYGHGQAPVHITVDLDELEKLMHNHAHMLLLDIDSKIESCLIKDVQWHYLGSHIIHADFARVDLNEKVTVSVDVEISGDAVGLKESGAYLDLMMKTMEITCLASGIPNSIVIDVAELQAGATLSVADITLPAGTTATADPTDGVVSIHIIAASGSDGDSDTDADSSEPEVIGAKPEEAGA